MNREVQHTFGPSSSNHVRMSRVQATREPEISFPFNEEESAITFAICTSTPDSEPLYLECAILLTKDIVSTNPLLQDLKQSKFLQVEGFLKTHLWSSSKSGERHSTTYLIITSLCCFIDSPFVRTPMPTTARRLVTLEIDVPCTVTYTREDDDDGCPSPSVTGNSLTGPRSSYSLVPTSAVPDLTPDAALALLTDALRCTDPSFLPPL